MTMRQSLLLVSVLWLPAQLGFSVCQKWGTPKAIGFLDRKDLPEASGMTFSPRYDDRLYHVNDSGDSARFFVTDSKGKTRQEVKLKSYAPTDIEDLSSGWCDQSKQQSCLFLADIGDNKSKRKDITILVISEHENFEEHESIKQELTLKYPDGAHNAESLAVHPNGDIFIVTKGIQTYLYRLPYAAWSGNRGKTIILQKIAEFSPIGKIADDADMSGVAFATGMSISPDGKSFALLTYLDALVYNIDLTTVKPGTKFNNSSLRAQKLLVTAKLKPLQQQEAIAFAQDGKSFLYTSEAKKKDEPIMQVSCED